MKTYTIPEAYNYITKLWTDNAPMPIENYKNFITSTREGLTQQIDEILLSGGPIGLVYYCDPFYKNNIPTLWLWSSLLIDITSAKLD